MSAKTSAVRREAFFRALAETGNQTIAAERARVSRSWVTLHRAEEPGFRERMESAIAEARERLRAAEGMAPASGWGTLDGEELVVRGTNGRRTQIARARLKQWTPRAEARFLATLAATCNVKAACAEAGLTQASAYLHYRRWAGFARQWQEALALGYVRIEMALVQHAGNVFSGEAFDPDGPLPPMTFDQAIQLLRLHQKRVRGVGKWPGRMARAPDWDAARASILRKIDAIERHAALSREERAPFERACAERRERRGEAG